LITSCFAPIEEELEEEMKEFDEVSELEDWELPMAPDEEDSYRVAFRQINQSSQS